MTNRFCFFALAAVIALAVAAPSTPVRADDTASVTTVKKKKPKRHVAKRQQSPYSELEPYRSNGFIGEFPGSCAYDRAAGRCMIDLGYGRCVSCDVGGGGRF